RADRPRKKARGRVCGLGGRWRLRPRHHSRCPHQTSLRVSRSSRGTRVVIEDSRSWKTPEDVASRGESTPEGEVRDPRTVCSCDVSALTAAGHQWAKTTR